MSMIGGIIERLLLEDDPNPDDLRVAWTESSNGMIVSWAVALPDGISLQQLWESYSEGDQAILVDAQSLVRRYFAARFAKARARAADPD